MAFTQADLTAIDAAIASGTLRVRYRDRDVTYRSMDELMKIRNLMREELGVVANGGITYQTVGHDKGLL